MFSSGPPVNLFQFQTANTSIPSNTPLTQTMFSCPIPQPAKKALEVAVGYIWNDKFRNLGGLKVQLAAGLGAIGKLSSVDGPIRFDGLLDQDYELSLPTVDAALWEGRSSEPLLFGADLSRAEATWALRHPTSTGSTSHTVLAGEGLDKIACRHGHAPETIWQHVDNRLLTANRLGWNVLAPNDVLSIPPVTQKFVSVRPGYRYFLVRHRLAARFRLRLAFGRQNIADTAYILELPGCDPVTGKTSGDGLIDIPVPAFASTAKLTLATTPDKVTFTLTLESLLPIQSDAGVQQRLRNLGFPYDSPFHPWASGVIRRAEETFGLAHTGAISEELRKVLFSQHDR